MQLLLQQLLLCFLLAFTYLPVRTYAQNNRTSQITFVSLNPSAFKKELGQQKGIILDVRTPAEYAKGHLPNAINLNYLDPNFKQTVKKLKPGQPYFVYCAVGGRSAKACTQLQESGLKNIYNLAGGITAWQQAGQTIVK